MVLEPLESRLLLSVSALPAIDSAAFGDVPQLVALEYSARPAREYLPSEFGATRTGSVTTEGDGILHADGLRALFGGVTGDGIKIGVISDGVDNWGDVADDPYYDLPESITVDPTRQGSGNEGTAMLEIIHDIAPDASLYFSCGVASAESMAGAVGWLVGQGVDVIVDDVGWYDQPMFQDGTIANAVADAVGEGVVYVSAAGNDAQTHYQGDYEATSGQNSFHLFHTGDNILLVDVPTNGTIRGALQWSDEWGQSGNDYNLVLAAWTGAHWTVVDYSIQVQDGDDEPFEFVSYTNTYGYTMLGWLIDQAAGDTCELEFYTFGDIEAIDRDDVTTEDSIFGHPAVDCVITVGAINAADPSNDEVEPRSSNGPSTIYTNFSTQAHTPRDSLDVCGIDGVQTKIGLLGHFSNPFFGTSAAAPHIAGIAALLLEIDPTLTPAEIEDLITANADDIGTSGYDGLSGWGRANALATVTAAATALDLKAASDTGTSSTDDLTKLDNSASGKELQFDVTGTVAGATVTIYAGETEIGSAVATTSTTTVTTDGDYDLTDTGHSITARQTGTGHLESPATSALTVTVDTGNPTVDIGDVSPDPRGTAVASIAITFSEAIDHTKFTLDDLTLTRDGSSVSLAAADLDDSGNHVNWTLDDLDALTDKVGKYELTLTASGSEITDLAGNPLAADADDEWLMHTINGTGGADTIILERSGALTQVSLNSDPSYTVDMSNLSWLYVVTGAGDDELSIDFSAGNPLPSSGLDYDGGAGELLQILGTTGNDTVTLASTGATVNGAAIAYSNVTDRAVAVELGDDDDAITVNSGSFLFTNDIGPSGDDLTVTLTLNNSAAVTFDASQHLAALNLNDTSFAQLSVDGGSRFIKAAALSMEEDQCVPTSTLDLMDNNLIIDFEAGYTPIEDISAWVTAGCNQGTWDGTGIMSSVAADEPNHLTALGLLDNTDGDVGGLASLEGESVDATCILVKYTWWGDVDLSGLIDANDYDQIDKYYLFPPQDLFWYHGDFTYDDAIDANDYDKIDKSYLFQDETL